MSQNSINISSDPVSVDEDFSIGIAFSNADDISAFQFDLQFDNNAMQLRSGHSLTNRVGNHTISTNEIGDNIIRVVVISSTNETINPWVYSFISRGNYYNSYYIISYFICTNRVITNTIS